MDKDSKEGRMTGALIIRLMRSDYLSLFAATWTMVLCACLLVVDLSALLVTWQAITFMGCHWNGLAWQNLQLSLLNIAGIGSTPAAICIWLRLKSLGILVAEGEKVSARIHKVSVLLGCKIVECTYEFKGAAYSSELYWTSFQGCEPQPGDEIKLIVDPHCPKRTFVEDKGFTKAFG